MGYISIPKNYTASPSSFMGTPSLTINHEATQGLDSSNAFEGPEKLLEVWFAPSANQLGSAMPAGLKAVPEEIWKDMLDLVNCQVLSIVASDDVDAYLLSESSMFVWPHKLILKTCGTTTLLSGLPRILEIAAVFAGFSKAAASRGLGVAAAPYRVFYSRKNFLFPDRQRGPHRSWRDEVRTMDRLFLNGSAYMIGKMNGDHWYLYLTEPHTLLTPPGSPRLDENFPETETKVLNVPDVATVPSPADEHDETLEVLMTDLDEQNAKQFYLDHATSVAEKRYRNFDRETGSEHVDVFSNTSSDMSDIDSEGSQILPPELTTEGHALGTVVTESSGLSDVYPKEKFPDSRIDAYLFTPCGFSANGVIPSPDRKTGTHYFTVHVTPEPHCSYASFETNVPHSQNGQTTADIIQQVVDIFQPGRFSVTLFEAKPTSVFEGDADTPKDVKYIERHAARRTPKTEQVVGYRRVDRIVHDLEGYDLVFRYYERNDWKGGAPRLGEEGF
ncbi:adenosylmethionine decarboxylase SPE2 [Aspergillus chevalieri]|uniref:adenosylmethionine decarboxylase n=1 Tax=Aspergillus chevalieri TaxID=182096 RepID=A0A7R7VUN8_ASPCH|nr:spermidine resistance protein [Aspergillus chevalieri]BCR90970.1 spermidine resistance protein [Aspergillus chevalieri]